MPENIFNNNLNHIYQLFDHDYAEVRVILPQFINNLANFRQLLKKGTKEEMRFNAHKIKGELSTLGFEELSFLVAEIEMRLINGNYRTGEHEKFDRAAAQLAEDINVWLQRAKMNKE